LSLNVISVTYLTNMLSLSFLYDFLRLSKLIIHVTEYVLPYSYVILRILNLNILICIFNIIFIVQIGFYFVLCTLIL
jgi:hypothetical protein